VCCDEGEICDPARNRCCSPESPAVQCLVPDPPCAEKVERRYSDYVRDECVAHYGPGDEGSDMQEGSYYSLGCQISAYAIHRRSWLDECQKTPSDEACGPGRRCDPATGTCTPPRCEEAARSTVRRHDAVGAGEVGPIASASPRERASVAAADATASAIRRRLRGSRRRLHADADRLLSAMQTPAAVRAEPAAPTVVTAIVRYRRDVLALRASIARIRPRSARGRRARQLTLATLSLTAEGLEGFRRSALTADPRTATRHAKSARAAFIRAGRSTRSTRRALGCGRTC
jgi:hypothetical protein